MNLLFSGQKDPNESSRSYPRPQPCRPPGNERGTRKRTDALRHNGNGRGKKRQKTIPQSLELQGCCFQLAAYGFSVLVDRIISSKCNHNWQAAMFGLAMRACGNLPRSLPSAVATGGSPRRCRSSLPDSGGRRLKVCLGCSAGRQR